MGIRDWMVKNGAATTIVALLLLVGASVLVYAQIHGFGRELVDQAYFYDLGTGQLFHAGTAEIPPIKAPSGKTLSGGAEAGVRAHVLTCGTCGRDEFTGYLETYTPEAREALDQVHHRGSGPPTRSPMTLHEASEAGRMVATPSQNPEWKAAGSPEGRQIIEAARAKCDSSAATECGPRG